MSFLRRGTKLYMGERGSEQHGVLPGKSTLDSGFDFNSILYHLCDLRLIALPVCASISATVKWE